MHAADMNHYMLRLFLNNLVMFFNQNSRWDDTVFEGEGEGEINHKGPKLYRSIILPNLKVVVIHDSCIDIQEKK